MDQGVGQVVDKVESLGLSENTLFLFTSDNGPTYDRLGGSDSEYFRSAGPLKGLKGEMDEGGIRVPLIARWKGRSVVNQETDWVGAWWDVLPTLCEAANVDAPKEIDGVSFLPTILGDKSKQASHEFLYWESPGYTGQQAIRLGNWKAIRKGLSNPLHEGAKTPEWRLYDLSMDIGETNDVATEHPEVIKWIDEIAFEEHVPSEQFPLRLLDLARQ
jgi:arylsulfatase A